MEPRLIVAAGAPHPVPDHRPIKMPTRVHIRWMICRDMPAVLAIDARSFPDPWFAEDYLLYLRLRNHIGLVAEVGERVVGQAIYSLRGRRIHLARLAVDPEFRRQQVGLQLVRKLIDKLGPQRRRRITLDCRESALACQFFFRAAGFRAAAVRRGYYDGPDEDAYRFVYTHTPDDLEAT